MKAFNLLDINHQLENYQNLANQVLDAKTWNLYNIVPVLYCTGSKFWILSIRRSFFIKTMGSSFVHIAIPAKKKIALCFQSHGEAYCTSG